MANKPMFPTWVMLNNANFTSPTGNADLRTGLPQYGGALCLGDYADYTETDANAQSYSTNGTLHAGRYRFVQVDSAATAANVKTGTIGLMASLAQGMNVVTSMDKKLGAGLHMVIFLNSITPGNYGFVQELGDANVLMGGTASGSAGTAVYADTNSANNGTATSTSTSNDLLGYAEVTLGTSALKRVLLDLPDIQG